MTQKCTYPYIKLIFVLILISQTIFVAAQQPYGWVVMNQQELQGAKVNCFFQDSRGFVWLGSSEGLMQSSGLQFENVPIQPLNEEEEITAISEQPQGIIWLGTTLGRIFKLYNFEIIDSLKAANGQLPKITSLVPSVSGKIQVGTYGKGLFVGDGNQLLEHPLNTKLSDPFVYDIENLADGRIAVATDNGINFISDSKNEVVTQKDGLPDFIVKTLAVDENGILWAGMQENGFCSVDPSTLRVTLPDLPKWDFGIINSIKSFDNKICIATNRNGLLRFSPQLNKIEKIEIPSINNPRRINDLMLDEEGNIWMINNHSVYLILAEKVFYYPRIKNTALQNIHALFVNPSNEIWFSNDQGLYLMSPKNNEIQSFQIPVDLNRQKIMSLYEDHNGYLWAGTFGQGLLRVNPRNGKVRTFKQNDGLINGNILAIAGNTEEIWLATLGGASKINLGRGADKADFQPHFENFGSAEGLSNNFIYDIYIGKDAVWFATDGSGIIGFHNGEFKPLSNDLQFNKKIIYSIKGDENGNLWFIVSNEGLFKYSGGEITQIYQDLEHAHKQFTNVEVSNNGNVFISHENGLDVYDPQTKNFIHYEENAGLQDSQSDLNTLDCDQQGNIWFGTYNGLFRIKNISNHFLEQPKVALNKVLVFLEHIDFGKQHNFDFRSSHFTFSWSGIWFQHPDKVYYSVKLEGHDLDWMDTRNNQVIYSNLSPGKYTFKVKAGLYGNFRHANEDSYTFTIRPPYYQSNWFYLLAGSLLIVLIVIIVKIRERNMRQKQEILREKVMFQFENLRSQINPHFLFNSFSTLVALIDTNTEDAIKYVGELSALFRNILEYKDQDLITVEEELRIAENYIALQQKRYGKNLRIEMENLETISRKVIPPLTLQLLIENALKHNIVSSMRPLTIILRADISKGFIFVTNNLQLKKEAESSTGIGINNIVNRYKILTHREIIISKDEKTYSVGLPIIDPAQ